MYLKKRDVNNNYEQNNIPLLYSKTKARLKQQSLQTSSNWQRTAVNNNFRVTVIVISGS